MTDFVSVGKNSFERDQSMQEPAFNSNLLYSMMVLVTRSVKGSFTPPHFGKADAQGIPDEEREVTGKVRYEEVKRGASPSSTMTG